jgi:hypothetical protein
MRWTLLLLISAFSLPFLWEPAVASQNQLYLSGTVPVRGNVEVKTSPQGRLIVRQNSPNIRDSLKIQIQRRGPASLITASAP